MREFPIRPKLRSLGLVWLLTTTAAVPALADPEHAITMLGSAKYAADFDHFDYVNAQAPKGGSLRLHALGSFDTLNPYIVRGKPAAGVHHGFGVYFETLAKRSRDEPFSLYGLLAESIETPDDRSWVEFTLHPDATFSDGSPVTVADVIFSWDILKTKGLPNARATWSRVANIAETGPRPGSVYLCRQHGPGIAPSGRRLHAHPVERLVGPPRLRDHHTRTAFGQRTLCNR